MAHYKEGSFVQEVVDDLHFQQKLKSIVASNHSCYGCSKAVPEFITVEGDANPFDEKDTIRKIHDMKFHCEKMHPAESFRRACTAGDSSFINRRCNKCIHAGKPVMGSYFKGTGSNRIKVQQSLIPCKLIRSKTEFCYPYFWCDHFKLKKDD